MVGGALRHLQSLRLMKRDNGWIHTLLEEAENERMHLLTFIQARLVEVVAAATRSVPSRRAPPHTRPFLPSRPDPRQMKKPGPVFRGMVILTQGVVYNLFFLSYILSPKTCHRFVGYLEEEAVRTYTHAIHDIEAGHIPEWSNMPAPDIAKDYWCAIPASHGVNTCRGSCMALSALSNYVTARRLTIRRPRNRRLGENAKVRDLLLAVRADEACHSHVNHTLRRGGGEGIIRGLWEGVLSPSDVSSRLCFSSAQHHRLERAQPLPQGPHRAAGGLHPAPGGRICRRGQAEPAGGRQGLRLH